MSEGKRDGAVIAEAESAESRSSSEARWPLSVIPWVALLSGVELVLGSQTRNSGDVKFVVVVSLLLMSVGIGLYTLLVAMLSRRHFPRLRRQTAKISMVVGFVGTTLFHCSLLWGLAGALGVSLPEGAYADVLMVVGAYLCIGWGVILSMIAIYAFLTTVGEDRAATSATASEPPRST